MKTIGISFSIIALFVVLFIVSITSGATALAIVPICGWTPAIGFLGYSIGRAGLKVKIISDMPVKSNTVIAPIKRRQSRLANDG